MGWRGAGVPVWPLLSQEVCVMYLGTLPLTLCCTFQNCMALYALINESLAVLLGKVCKTIGRSAAMQEETQGRHLDSVRHSNADMEALRCC